MRRVGLLILCFACFACTDNSELEGRIADVAALSAQECQRMELALDENSMPKTFIDGQLVQSSLKWWCSGFFPGTCWYSYLLSNDETVLSVARRQTERMLDVDAYYKDHDIGFQIMSSAGLAFRQTGDAHFLPAIRYAAERLASRFSPVTGTIRSWDDPKYSYPVIIDNMMNLELLTFASSLFQKPEWRDIAIHHADRTMKEQFRADGSSYHMVEYNPETGAVVRKRTIQGYADESAWSRGQSWGLYGYTMMYRETGLARYLAHAETIAHYLLPLLADDPVPAWDFNSPADLAVHKDASAGAVMASAFIELSHLTSDKELAKRCRLQAEATLLALSSPAYLAKPGELGGFLLKRSTGFLLNDSEVDVPLTYADYYFLEALYRYKTLETGKQVYPGHPRILGRTAQFDALRKRLSSAEFPPLNRMHDIEMAAAEKSLADTSAVGFCFDDAHKRLEATKLAATRGVPCIYAYKMTGKKVYLDRALSLVREVCAFPDWNPAHFLDVAQAAYLCALAYDWLYEDLDGDTRALILDNLRDKVVFPAADPRYEFLLRKFNNWNQTCNGAVILAALALNDRDPLLCDRAVRFAIQRNLPAFAPMSAPDGVYPEGPRYMFEGMSSQILIFSILESAYGSDLGISNAPGFDRAGLYRLFSYGATNKTFNFSDNPGEGDQLSFPLMWYFANRTGDASLLYKELEFLPSVSEDEFPNKLYPMCILHASAFKGGEIHAPEQLVFAGNGPQPVVMARTGWGSDDLYLGVKGGNPALDHAHMDAGSFVFDGWGYRWASDMGCTKYAYFEKRLPSERGLWNKRENSLRWKLYLYNNRFHNTLTVNNEDHAVTGYVPLLEAYDAKDCMGGYFDLNNAFKGNTARARRKAVIKDGSFLEVTDDIQASEEEGCTLRWNLATPASVSVEPDGLLLRQGDVDVLLQCRGGEVTWYAAPADASRDGYADWDWTPPGLTMCGWTCTLAKNERLVITTTLKRTE